jgi:hypothetical protein
MTRRPRGHRPRLRHSCRSILARTRPRRRPVRLRPPQLSRLQHLLVALRLPCSLQRPPRQAHAHLCRSKYQQCHRSRCRRYCEPRQPCPRPMNVAGCRRCRHRKPGPARPQRSNPSVMCASTPTTYLSVCHIGMCLRPASAITRPQNLSMRSYHPAMDARRNPSPVNANFADASSRRGDAWWRRELPSSRPRTVALPARAAELRASGRWLPWCSTCRRFGPNARASCVA